MLISLPGVCGLAHWCQLRPTTMCKMPHLFPHCVDVLLACVLSKNTVQLLKLYDSVAWIFGLQSCGGGLATAH